MAKASATSTSPPRRGCRAHALPAPFLPRAPLRFLLRLRRRLAAAVDPSSPKTLPATKKRKRAHLPETPPPTHGVEAPPKKPKRPAAEEQPHDAQTDAAAAGKYWNHRHSLFSLYDCGVRMDAEAWYSATPEAIAAAQACRAEPAGLVVDAFAGAGGNSIQFAARGCYVVAVEIDPRKVELAAHNARVYGVEDRIDFIVGDFFHLAPFLKADLVILSPPWGGPSYIQTPVYTLDMLKPKDGVDIRQVEELSWLSSPPLDFESEESYIKHRLKGITAYFGNTARRPSSLLKQR